MSGKHRAPRRVTRPGELGWRGTVYESETVQPRRRRWARNVGRLLAMIGVGVVVVVAAVAVAAAIVVTTHTR